MFWSSLCCTHQCRNRELPGRCVEPLRLNCGSAAAPPACHQESLQTEEEIKGNVDPYQEVKFIMQLKNIHDCFTSSSH